MSNSLAIAATTATLRNLLQTQVPLIDTSLSDLDVTTQPLDLARKHVTKSQLNLFLYQTVINAGWRNMQMPGQLRPGESGMPPLPINLHYLITAYGRGEDADGVNHQVLGAAMSVLHDTPVLDRAAIAAALAKNDLGAQFESLRITPLATSVDELSKLWMVFQTQYRISAAYEVTVILIDSLQQARSPLPVLQRGQGDKGVTSVARTLPVLTGIVMPRSQLAARLGDNITLQGKALSTNFTTVRFTSPRLDAPVELTPTVADEAGNLAVHIPSKIEDINVLQNWTPGQYTVALVLRLPGVPELLSDEIAFALAPQITIHPPLSVTKGTVNLTIDCEPRLTGDQRVLLLFGDRQIKPASINTPAMPAPTTLTFSIPNVDVGSYVVRLRVDGADSIPVIYSGTPPLPAFDGNQTVTVTP
jgi:hypothetical protein